MGLIHIFERGDDARKFDESMKKAKSGLMEACEIWEDMKEQFSQRGGYGERGDYGERGMGSYRHREEWPEYEERRGRDSRGRYL